jgi:hypothetical protein
MLIRQLGEVQNLRLAELAINVFMAKPFIHPMLVLFSPLCYHKYNSFGRSVYFSRFIAMMNAV